MNAYSPDPGALPTSYREVLYWSLGDRWWKLALAQLLSLPLFAFWAVVFLRYASWLGDLPAHLRRFPELNAPLALAIGLLVLVLHELMHGAAMALFGAQPSYGIKWRKLLLYATAHGFAFRRNDYIGVALAPLLGLSGLALAAIAILAGNPAGNPWVIWIIVYAALNAAGAAGDLWIALIVLRFPPQARVIDERDGMRVFVEASFY